MVKFKNKVDGSVFIAEPNSVLFRVLSSDSNYEIVKEDKPKKKAAK